MPLKTPGDPIRLAALAGLWLAFFALLFTLGASLDLWPQLPPGALRGTDFAAGVAFTIVILFVLLRAIARGRE